MKHPSGNKLTFPRKKSQNSYQSRSLVHEVLFLFCKKDTQFKNTDFSRLKCQLKRKKVETNSMFVKNLKVSADEGMGK